MINYIELEAAASHIEWLEPEAFEEEYKPQPFPLKELPDVLRNYVSELVKSCEVYPEMCILPMLSTLALCVQGKAFVSKKTNSFRQPLTLYTLTVAEPGERKSSVVKAFMLPIENYQYNFNQKIKSEIERNEIMIKMLEKQQKFLFSKNNKSLNDNDLDFFSGEALKIQQQLSELKSVHSLVMNITDATPEAVADILQEQDERIGIIDDEGGIFDIISGLYNNGNSNIDIFLKAYDGSNCYVKRCNKRVILNNPLLTIGISTQYMNFNRAMSNSKFLGRGLIHRFLFSFPDSMAGQRANKGIPISAEIQEKYFNLIERLLNIPYPEGNEIPIIHFTNKALEIAEAYEQNIEQMLKKGQPLHDIKEWGSKHFARYLKIAAILHLTENDISEPMTELTAQRACAISDWCINQSLKAFGTHFSMSDELKKAKKALEKIIEFAKKEKRNCFSRTDITKITNKINKKERDEVLDLLIEMQYIQVFLCQKRTCYALNPDCLF